MFEGPAAAEGGEGSFVDGFSELRVGMDDRCDVVEHGAHLDQCDTSSGQFADRGTDGLHPEHEMIVTTGDDPHEAVRSVEREGAPVGGERERS